MSPTALVLALLIGGSLGLVGGGGSILTVPALVYAVGLEPHAAVAASLVVVGLTALGGALAHSRLGTIDWRVAAWFGGIGSIGSLLGGLVGRHVPPSWLMGAFAAIAVIAGTAMVRGGRERPQGSERPRRALVVTAAVCVGFLTGFLGVGGGFLIVPALVLAVGLPMLRAVGTSLGVIALNCAAGLVASAGRFEARHVPVVAVFAALAIAGSQVGTRIGRRSRPVVLRRLFGVLVLLVGLYTALRALVVL